MIGEPYEVGKRICGTNYYYARRPMEAHWYGPSADSETRVVVCKEWVKWTIKDGKKYYWIDE